MNAEPRDDPFVQRLAEHLDRLAEQAGTPQRGDASEQASVLEPAGTPERVDAPEGTDTPEEAGAPGSAALPPADSAGAGLDLTAAVVTQLRAATTWIEPPADLRAAVLARVLNLGLADTDTDADTETADHVSAEAPELSAPSPLSPQPLSPPSSSLSSPPSLSSVPSSPTPPAVQPEDDAAEQPVVFILRRRQLKWAIPIAAVAAVTFTFSVLAVEHALEPGSRRGVTYVASGTPLAPEASARVSVASAAAGFSVVIDAHDLPAAAPGSYYVAWLRGPRGTVPIGSVHARRSGRPITMWSGVDPTAYPTFLLTLQQEGEPVTPSRFVVLTASLTGS